MYRPILLAGALLLGLAPAHAGQSDDRQQELISQREKKMSKPFVTKAPWIADYDKARAKARETGLLIFGYFTRSFSP